MGPSSLEMLQGQSGVLPSREVLGILSRRVARGDVAVLLQWQRKPRLRQKEQMYLWAPEAERWSGDRR